MQPVVQSAAPTQEKVRTAQPVMRNVAMDAYRGFVMLLMMGEVLQFARVYRAYPDSTFWRILAFNQTHVEWAGCSLHDLIQPSFSFLVGVALPYSIASRLAKGKTFDATVRTRDLAVAPAGRTRHLSALDAGADNQFHLRRHADADRPRLHVPVPARVPPAALAVDRAGGNSLRLLAGVGALSGPGPGFDYQRSACRRTGRTTSPASPRTGTRTAISAMRSTSGS